MGVYVKAHTRGGKKVKAYTRGGTKVTKSKGGSAKFRVPGTNKRRSMENVDARKRLASGHPAWKNSPMSYGFVHPKTADARRAIMGAIGTHTGYSKYSYGSHNSYGMYVGNKKK